MSNQANGTHVAVVGGGPAGIHAARELLEHGLNVTLFDESPALGGQYYRQYQAAPDVPRNQELDDRRQEGRDLIASVDMDRLNYVSGALVWALAEGPQLAVYRDGQLETYTPDAVVLATGAVERIHAFPGWTLPGVMAAGGVQSMLSREGILPGRRFLVAGTGPLLLGVAAEIAEAGGTVVAVIEGSSRSAPVRHLHRFLRQMRRVRQAVDYRRLLQRYGIALEYGQTVVEAHGDEGLERVVVSGVDSDWRPVPGSERSYDVDTLCLHFGFRASLELARMVGCETSYDPAHGGWFVKHDQHMRTSQEGVYVAGQSAGIGGVDLASATGKLAGAAVAADLGKLDERAWKSRATDLGKEVDEARGFADVLNQIYAPGVGIADTITPATMLCRCEDVPARDVQTAIDAGARTVNDVKRRTRCGMGFCQGRICTPIVASYLWRHANASPEEAGLVTARPPVRPIPFGAVAQAANRD